MKIRSGFVSNSSSSSFIINANEKLSTVRDVAKYIIDVVKDTWYYDELYTDELNTLMKLSDPDSPVYFDTGGDETYIRKYDNKIVIVTTQNITFDEIYNVALKKEDLTEDFYKYWNFDYQEEHYDVEHHIFDDPSDFYNFYKKFNDFVILRYNILGREEYVYNCPHCKRFISRGLLLNNNKKVCLCQIGRVIRKEKLIKISEHE